MAKWHHLKTWPEYFEAARRGDKDFEFRKNDRKFQETDYVVLEEYDPQVEEYTGRVLSRTISYILHDGFGLPEGTCIMQLKKI